MSCLKRVSFLFTFLAFVILNSLTKAVAQDYRYEFGGASGISCYMGDANKTDIFYKPGGNASLLFRYNFNMSVSAKGFLSYSQIRVGLNKDNVDFATEGMNIKRSLFEIGGQIEFNLRPYSNTHSFMGSMPYTPYFLVGLGVVASPNKKGLISPSLPIGVGFKYKLSSQLNIGVEFSMRKLFTDKLDTKGSNIVLDSPYGIKSSFLKNKDWYSLAVLSLSWSFGERCNPCD